MTKTKEIQATNNNTCLCGCSHIPGAGRFFAPGHDARVVSQVIRGEVPHSVLTPFPALLRKASVGHEALVAKRQASKVNGLGHARGKAESAATREVTKVKVGRWVYPVISIVEIYTDEITVVYATKKGEEVQVTVPRSAVN